ncbi:MAG TPA: FecR domain-containing protein [Sphingomonadaceae bacterium]|nr:FecR domain-containing protein [Sphingomonadaceae bacterium]
MSKAGMHAENAIDVIAAQWTARRARGLTASESAELEAWRAADPRHRGSYLRALALERLAVQSLAPSAEEQAKAQRFAGQQDQSLSERAGSYETQAAAALVRFGRRSVIGGAIAASVAAGLGLGSYIYLSAQRYATEVGEIRSIVLDDGSNAVVNTGSAITVSLGEDRRLVELEKGEAWFDVAQDASRPFEVRYGDFRVRATGTAFQVAGTQRGLEVLVTEGSVVVLKGNESTPFARLRAGEKLTVEGKATNLEVLGAGRVEEKLAWRQGMVVLDGMTLAEAAGALNRYNKLQISVVSPELARRRIFGTFRVNDPVSVAKAMAIATDAQMERGDSGIVLHD